MTSIRVTLPEANAGMMATAQIGKYVNGKIKYTTVATKTIGSDGKATYTTGVVIKTGDRVRVQIDGKNVAFLLK